MSGLVGDASGISEVTRALLRFDVVEDLSDGASECVAVPGGGVLEPVLDHGERLLDQVQVRPVRRQEEQVGADRADRPDIRPACSVATRRYWRNSSRSASLARALGRPDELVAAAAVEDGENEGKAHARSVRRGLEPAGARTPGDRAAARERVTKAAQRLHRDSRHLEPSPWRGLGAEIEL